MTHKILSDIIKIEKGKTSNGYADNVLFLVKNNATIGNGWRYFFMANIIANNNIINTIIYV